MLTGALIKVYGLPQAATRSQTEDDVKAPKPSPDKQLLHRDRRRTGRYPGHHCQRTSTRSIWSASTQLRRRHAVWRQKAQQTVDNAEMRYFVVHLHRLLDPETEWATSLR